MSLKVAIIGAGSASFSTRVVMDLALTESLKGSAVSLMDVDERRLEMIHRLATRASQELGAGLSVSKTMSREEALAGADFVINTALTGGHDWLEAQRELSERHGYYRGVGIVNGDGGMHGFGQMALMLDVARDIERICPDAWLIQSSNPVFEGCTMMARETKVKVVGLCHGHFGYHRIARVLGLDLQEVTARMPGFNHWIFMTEFRYRGEDAYPLLDRWIEKESEQYWRTWQPRYSETQMSPAAIHQYQLYGVMPIGDAPRFVGWWYQTDLAARKRWYNEYGGFDSEVGWGLYLEGIAERIRQVAEVAQDESRKVTDVFEPTRSTEQIVGIIDSIAHDNPAIYQVNIPNRGPLIPGYPEDLVVEVQGLVDRGGIHGMAEPPFSARLNLGAMVPRWQKAETMVEAFRRRDRQLLLHYLLHEPRTRTLEQAEGFLADWLADPRNRVVAERFAV